MKKAIKLIQLWKDWKPTDVYFAPYTVANYYWFVCNFFKLNTPLFPIGEINDIAAFLSGSKPSAVISVDKNFCMDNDCENGVLVKEFIKTARKKKKKVLIEKIKGREKTIYFANNNEDLAKLKKAWENNDILQIGLMLGYPIKSIESFIKNGQEGRKILKKAIKSGQDIKQALIKCASCFKNNFLNSHPDFSIGKEWFEDT